MPQEAEVPQDETEKQRLAREFADLRSLRVDQAEALLKLFRDEVYVPEQERMNARSEQPNDEICAKCHRAEGAVWPGHDAFGVDWNKCCKCSKWFHNMCVDLDPEDAVSVEWKCPKCVRIRG